MVKGQTEIEKILSDALDYLSGKIAIDRAVLFGSYVNGEPDEWSDIDIAVFSRTVRDWTFEDKLVLMNGLKKVCPDVELHLYSDADLREARPTNFYGHILETGKKVA